MKQIELELRAEISQKELAGIRKRLAARGFRKVSATRRTSVMSFGQVSDKGKGWKGRGVTRDVDIRCRVTNGKAEVVGKIGETHASNRVEVSVPVSLDQLCAFADLFAEMGFLTKVGSKFTENYTKGPMTVSIVQSPSGIVYVEMELLSDRQNEKKGLVRLQALADELGVKVIKSRKAFLELCQRLTDQDDWPFKGTPADVQRLRKEIARVRSGRED